METIVLSLAEGLAELCTPSGFPEFELTLVTETPVEDFDESVLPFHVFRQQSIALLLRMIRPVDSRGG